MANKSLGQNFLHGSGTISRIISSLKLTGQDVILEIGCGTGALTRHLVGKPRQFIGIEIDADLWSKLNDTFRGHSNLFLNQDILTVDLDSLRRTLFLEASRIKIVGNIPYYISSPLIIWLANQADLLDSAIIMFQKEVGERLTASPGSKEYGLLTLLAQYYFHVSPLFVVKAREFHPKPKVDSQVIYFEPVARTLLPKEKSTAFFSFLKSCFSHRRKTLVNCLKTTSYVGEKLEALMKEQNLASDIRSEALSLKELAELFLALDQQT